MSYEKIRGKGGAESGSNAIGGDAFLGLLRNRTGIAFDLPTDCQLEYACAAGVAADYNNGGACTNGKANASMDAVGRYRFNGGWNDAKWGRFKWTTFDKAADRECDTDTGTAAVGSYLPNTWGFYDMHGNVWEWCLDWYVSRGTSGFDSGAVTDPKGDASGSDRVLRGGSWYSLAQYCRSAYRNGNYSPSYSLNYGGFRLCCPAGL